MTEPTTYKCPQCGATLRPPNPVPAGKKIKCPKCQNIFAPAAADQPKAAAGKPSASKPDDDDGGGLYALKDEPAAPEPQRQAFVPEDDDDDGGPKKKKKKKKDDESSDLEKDLLAKQAPTRKKGAAQAICQKPSNQMLATSSFACASCVLSLMMALWPIVFSKNRIWEIPLLVTESFPILVLIPLLIGAFLYNGVIAIGAVKMQSAESYGWAMMASMLTVIPVSWLLAVPAFAWFYRLLEKILGPGNLIALATVLCISIWYLYVGMWNLKTLRDAEVIEGFAEKGPEYGD